MFKSMQKIVPLFTLMLMLISCDAEINISVDKKLKTNQIKIDNGSGSTYQDCDTNHNDVLENIEIENCNIKDEPGVEPERPPLCKNVFPPTEEDFTSCDNGGSQVEIIIDGGCVADFLCNGVSIKGSENPGVEPGDGPGVEPEQPPLCEGVTPPTPEDISNCAKIEPVISSNGCVESFLCATVTGPGPGDEGDNCGMPFPEVPTCEEGTYFTTIYLRGTSCVLEYTCSEMFSFFGE